MTALINVAKCRRATLNEIAKNKECLNGLNSTGDHGQMITHNIENIIENKQAIAEQRKAAHPDMQKIAHFEKNVQLCLDSIGTRLKRLGAKPDEVAKITDDIKNNTLQLVTLAVLKLMAAKNPGMYQRKYDAALAQHQR